MFPGSSLFLIHWSSHEHEREPSKLPYVLMVKGWVGAGVTENEMWHFSGLPQWRLSWSVSQSLESFLQSFSTQRSRKPSKSWWIWPLIETNWIDIFFSFPSCLYDSFDIWGLLLTPSPNSFPHRLKLLSPRESGVAWCSGGIWGKYHSPILCTSSMFS